MTSTSMDMQEQEMRSRQAFLVYCNHAVRDAVKKNDKLRAQNAKLENVRNILVHMKIWLGLDELLNINMQTHPGRTRVPVEEDRMCDHIQYNVESYGVEIPFHDIPHVRYEPANVYIDMRTGMMTRRLFNVLPRVTVNEEDETVWLAFPVCEGIGVRGTVKNFAGTLQDLQDIIDSGRFHRQFLLMGFIDTTTGQPTTCTIDSCLDGATFRFHHIMIYLKIMPPLVSMDEDETRRMSEEKVNDGYLSNEEGTIDNELQVLAKVNKNHNGLAKAVLDRKTLSARNWLLVASEGIFKTITAHYKYHGRKEFQFRLDGGHIGPMIIQQDDPLWVMQGMIVYAAGLPSWVMQPVVWQEEDDEATATEAVTIPIPLACIRTMRLDLANFPWSCRAGPAYVGRPHFYGNIYMAFKYGPHVEAVFAFDDSLDDVDLANLPGGVCLYQYVYDVLRHAVREDGLQLTMRLLELRVSLPFIEQHLEALGIIEVSHDSNGDRIGVVTDDDGNDDDGNDDDDDDDGDE